MLIETMSSDIVSLIYDRENAQREDGTMSVLILYMERIWQI